MATQLRENKLDFWIQNNYNVLFKGKHGVGKTTMIIDAFDRNKLKWKYFSASTLDPWVDVVGVPRAKKREDGSTVLELVRPEEFENDEIEAIFFDEYNRSHKKVRNAVMELIQFKSINGKKFNNLRVIWAAVNPDDDDTEEYDVEKIDPAQLDRFHVHIDVPYKPNLSYFSNKFGKELAEAGCSWWQELPKEMKNAISPRRLDYALEMYKSKGDLRDVLPSKSNINKLLITIEEGPIKKQLDKLLKAKDTEKTKAFLAKENNYAAAINYITKTAKYKEYFLPLLPEEKISSLIASNKTLQKYFAEKSGIIDVYEKVISEIVKANQNKQLVRNLKKYLPKSVKRRASGIPWANQIQTMHKKSRYNTQQRSKLYDELIREMPDNMTLQEAVTTVDLINSIVDRSHPNTVNRTYSKLPTLLTTLFSVIARDTGLSTVDDIIAYRSWYPLGGKLGTAKSKIKLVNVKPYTPIGGKPVPHVAMTEDVKKLIASSKTFEEFMDKLS